MEAVVEADMKQPSRRGRDPPTAPSFSGRRRASTSTCAPAASAFEAARKRVVRGRNDTASGLASRSSSTELHVAPVSSRARSRLRVHVAAGNEPVGRARPPPRRPMTPHPATRRRPRPVLRPEAALEVEPEPTSAARPGGRPWRRRPSCTEQEPPPPADELPPTRRSAGRARTVRPPGRSSSRLSDCAYSASARASALNSAEIARLSRARLSSPISFVR
jgi:hypothetical protein